MWACLGKPEKGRRVTHKPETTDICYLHWGRNKARKQYFWRSMRATIEAQRIGGASAIQQEL